MYTCKKKAGTCPMNFKTFTLNKIWVFFISIMRKEKENDIVINLINKLEKKKEKKF